MLNRKLAENATGTIGTVLWTVQLVPQIWKSWREKSTDGLSPWLVLIWSISALFFGVYVVVQKFNIPLMIQPQLFGVLSAFSWVQCLYYGQKKSLRVCIVLFFGYLLLFAGFEAGMTFVVQVADRRGLWRVKQFFCIFSTVLTSIGLFPQYMEIWNRKEVIGISITFMIVDMGGATFSTVSLAFRPEFDVIAAAAYLVVVILDSIVILAALILNPLARRKRARLANATSSPAGGRLGDPECCLQAPLPVLLASSARSEKNTPCSPVDSLLSEKKEPAGF